MALLKKGEFLPFNTLIIFQGVHAQIYQIKIPLTWFYHLKTLHPSLIYLIPKVPQQILKIT